MLAEIILKNKKIKIKGADGKYMKDADGKYIYKTISVPYSTERHPKWKQKQPKVPKWAKEYDKKAKGIKEKKSRAIRPFEWKKMELDKKRRDLNASCGLNRQILMAEYEAFYKKYPQAKRPVVVKPTKSDKALVPCSDERFSTCETTIYTHPSGNRKIVTTEKLPAVKKEKKAKKIQQTKKYKWKNQKGIADCSCYL